MGGKPIAMHDAAMNHIKQVMLSLALILVVLCIPHACYAQDTLVKVYGYVYQAGTSKTIADAFLQTDDGTYTTFSNASGYYCLLLPSGFHVVTASAGDYIGVSWGVTVNSDDVPWDFHLLPTADIRYTVSGSVYDEESGSLLPVASVVIPSIGFAVVGEGTFAFQLPNGTYDFAVSGEGYLNTSAFVTIDGSDVTMDFYLTKPKQEGTWPDQWWFVLLVAVAATAIAIMVALRSSDSRKRR
jgi:hypothetical protein